MAIGLSEDTGEPPIRIIPVYTPRALIEAGERLMQEQYAQQQEHRRVQAELSHVQQQCLAVFSAG